MSPPDRFSNLTIALFKAFAVRGFLIFTLIETKSLNASFRHSSSKYFFDDTFLFPVFISSFKSSYKETIRVTASPMPLDVSKLTTFFTLGS